jgi:hypothetical protein
MEKARQQCLLVLLHCHVVRTAVLCGGVCAGVQNLDDRVLDRIDDVLDSTDLLLIVGTSSVVYPAAGYAPQVAQRWVLSLSGCAHRHTSSLHCLPNTTFRTTIAIVCPAWLLAERGCAGNSANCSVIQAPQLHGLLGD